MVLKLFIHLRYGFLKLVQFLAQLIDLICLPWHLTSHHTCEGAEHWGKLFLQFKNLSKGLIQNLWEVHQLESVPCWRSVKNDKIELHLFDKFDDLCESSGLLNPWNSRKQVLEHAHIWHLKPSWRLRHIFLHLLKHRAHIIIFLWVNLHAEKILNPIHLDWL